MNRGLQGRFCADFGMHPPYSLFPDTQNWQCRVIVCIRPKAVSQRPRNWGRFNKWYRHSCNNEVICLLAEARNESRFPSALSVPLSIVRAGASRHNQSKFLSASPSGQFSVSCNNTAISTTFNRVCDWNLAHRWAGLAYLPSNESEKLEAGVGRPDSNRSSSGYLPAKMPTTLIMRHHRVPGSWSPIVIASQCRMEFS